MIKGSRSPWPGEVSKRRESEDESRHSHRIYLPGARKRKTHWQPLGTSTANAKLSDSAYYNSKSIPSEPVSAVEKRREHDEFRKHEDRRRDEQDEDAGGNLTRQEGAEFAAREGRCSVVPSPILATSAGGSQRSSFVDPHFYEDVAPLLMPIESPTRNCATTPTSLKTNHNITCSTGWTHSIPGTHVATPTQARLCTFSAINV